jgi:Protein of unknown function DUF262/Protein of unknown function (DUF1524)
MDAHAIPLLKLYETVNKAYVIPLYQRPFAWDSRKAEELLNAVLQDATDDAKITSLGTLLFCNIPGANPFSNNTPTTIAPSTMWEVVDGQQRLTVFAIIGYALNERHKALIKDGLVYSPPLEFDMLFATSRTRAGKTVPVLIRDGDNYDTGFQSDLAKMLNSFAGHADWPEGVGKRLIETRNAIVNWANEELNADNFATFSEHFLSKCTVVQVVADDQDTAFTMFEPLNSTSEPLTAFEVYRSKAVRQLHAQFPKTELLLAYEESKRDEVISRSNTLIFSMAQVTSGLRPRIHFVPLKHYLDTQVNAPFIAHFEDAADFFRTVWIEQTATDAWFDDEAKNCVRFLKAMSHDIAIPLVLRYYLTQRADVGKVLRIVVAFYSLWRAAYPTNALPKIYRALLSPTSADDVSIEGGKALKSTVDLAAYFKAKLSDKIGALAAEQTIDQKWSVDSNLNYEELKTLCRLFIFLDMGATIKTNLVPDDPWTSVDDVEHIFPSGLVPAPSNVHRIGNLTFLPSKVNKSLQDTPWLEKREVYAWLANPAKVAPPANYVSTGSPVPRAARDFIVDVASPALGHLAGLSANPTWGEAEIEARSTAILDRVWAVLHDGWLNP